MAELSSLKPSAKVGTVADISSSIPPAKEDIVADPSSLRPPAKEVTVADISLLRPLAKVGTMSDTSLLITPSKEGIMADPTSLKPPPRRGSYNILKNQMNAFAPLKTGVVQKMPSSMYPKPDRVRVALPVPDHEQTPYIRYTMDTGVLNWVCTACRTGASNWLLYCDCFKPLHHDCRCIDFASEDFISARDYMCKGCYLKLPCGK
jgi:hypothetical protein